MEIFTLLKSNIRHRKGSFVSIIILMLIVSMSFTAIFSMKNNVAESIKNEYEYVNVSDLWLYMNTDSLTDDLLSSVENHSSVKDVNVKESVLASGCSYKDAEVVGGVFMLKLTDDYRLLNDDLNGYADEVPEINKGEIYITHGLSVSLGCGIGDTIKLNTVTGEKEFTVKHFIVEPVFGYITTSYNMAFISDEDFDILQKEAVEYSTEQFVGDIRVIDIYKANESISDNDFATQLNSDTGIIDFAEASMPKSILNYYCNLMPDMILSVLLAFILFLVIIVLIVMGHSISTSIEMEYTSLGVLKAQGFTKGKIKVILALQYVFAEVLGSVIGIILAIPIVKIFENILQPLTSIPSTNNISILTSILFIVAVVAVSIIFIALMTRKVGKISPMKAISGGKNDVYFSNRLNAPITKKALSTSLAFRQFTSNKRRYISTTIVVSILMFFMITMNVLGSSMDSTSAMKSMGMPLVELSFVTTEVLPDEKVEEIEDVIESYTEIDTKYYVNGLFFTLNENEYMCSIYKNPEVMVMLEGRYPQYDNEIAVTDILADELDLKIGDKVTVSNKDNKEEYVITGFNTYANNLGINFSMPYEAAQKLDIPEGLTYSYDLVDASECQAIAEELNEKYSDLFEAKGFEQDQMLSLYTTSIDAMTILIYIISIVFSLVVIMMFCKKAFLQERRDIGIYKSLGFTSTKLRLQFAVRFLIVSLIGSAFGAVLSVLFTQPILTATFRILGVSVFNAQFTVMSFVIPILIVAVSFFVFSFFASRKIKKVEIKELVVE